MPGGYFSTSAFEPSIRRDAWARMIDRRCGPFVASFLRPEFDGSIDSRTVGGFDCARLMHSAYRAVRGKPEVERGRQSDYFVILQSAGTSLLGQADRVADMRPGDVTIIDSARPSNFQFERKSVQLSLHVPRDILDTMDVAWDHRLATLLPRSSAEVLGALLRAAFEQAEGVGPAQENAIRDSLLAMVAAGWRGYAEALPNSVWTQDDQLRKIQSYIVENLHDDGLTPCSIACAQRISERQLHRIFGAAGLTVCRWIRQVRLDRCASHLLSASHRNSTITEIAFGAGFNDGAHFSRLFRAEFGQAPSAFRAAGGGARDLVH